MKKGLIPFSEKLTHNNYDIMEVLKIFHFFGRFEGMRFYLYLAILETPRQQGVKEMTPLL